MAGTTLRRADIIMIHAGAVPVRIAVTVLAVRQLGVISRARLVASVAARRRATAGYPGMIEYRRTGETAGALMTIAAIGTHDL